MKKKYISVMDVTGNVLFVTIHKIKERLYLIL